jgi:hypothetical protein
MNDAVQCVCPCGWRGPWSSLWKLHPASATPALHLTKAGEPLVCPQCLDGDRLEIERAPVFKQQAFQWERA